MNVSSPLTACLCLLPTLHVVLLVFCLVSLNHIGQELIETMQNTHRKHHMCISNSRTVHILDWSSGSIN